MSAVTPPAVARFMAGQGWELEKRREGVREIWRYPSNEEGPGYRYRIMLPLAEDYEDHEERFGDTLIALGRIYDLDPWELLESIRSPGFDAIVIDLHGDGQDAGTVTLIQAKSVMDGFFKLLENAAIRASNPQSSGSGRRSKRVTKYLSEDVIFHGFSRDSLSLMIMSRLRLDRLKVASEEHGRDSYARQVVKTLIGDLTAMHSAADRLRGRPTGRFEDVGLASVNSLASMTGSLDLSAIDFSFHLAAGYEDTRESDVKVTFQRSHLDRIPDLKRALKPATGKWQSAALGESSSAAASIEKPEVAEEVVLQGPVQGVFRTTGDILRGESGGFMMMSAVLDNQMSTVRVRLNSREYSYAIEAHQQAIDVTVRGMLFRSERFSEVRGESVLDLDELIRALRD
ncbi:hypothetical protein ACWDSD_13440 [Streptomyces spiralis]